MYSKCLLLRYRKQIKAHESNQLFHIVHIGIVSKLY